MTAAKAIDVRLQIQRDFVTTLEKCPRMGEESSRELLVGNLGDRLGVGLSLRKQTTTRTYVIELVQVCARLPRGLELLAEELAYLDPLALEVPELLRLCDEWQAAETYADSTWSDLRSTLQSVELTATGQRRSELSVLRRLVATATESRVVELPKHCNTLWHAFVHLAGANALPNALPPCMVLLECVAQEVNDPVLARKLRTWNRTCAERWQLTDLLDAAWLRAAEPRKEAGSVHLIIQVEPDPVDGRLLITHWRLWEPDRSRPQRGANKFLALPELEAEVDRLVIELEAMLGEGADATQAEEIWLEFVLPTDLLNLPVQLWSKTALLDTKVPLALDHPLVVRSLDRLRARHLHRAWHRRWAELSRGPATHYWNRPHSLDFASIAAELSYDKRIMSVVLSEPPAPGNEAAQREIIAALWAGVPAIMWHQVDCSSIEFREAVSAMVADGALAHLPQRIAALRREALRQSAEPHDHPGRHVALLWDDPERIPLPRGVG